MNKTPRMVQIEAMLIDDPDDAFLRYGLAMEYASAGDDVKCAEILQALIASKQDLPYIPAYLMIGQTLARLGRETEAVAMLHEGIRQAQIVKTPEAMHAMGEMQGLLSTLE